MRPSVVLLPVLLYACSSIAQGTHPRPPGLAQASQAEAQAEKDMPPPAEQRAQRVDPAKLQREAQELLDLAQSIPPDVDKLRQGMLPKDMVEKLKQIEKLSKRLRSEITP